MLARWQFWLTTVIAVVVAVIAGYDMMLFNQNRAIQVELGRRAQYLQQTVQLEALYREMIKTLADLSARRQDKALRELLTSQGITFDTEAATPAGRSSSTDEEKAAKP